MEVRGRIGWVALVALVVLLIGRPAAAQTGTGEWNRGSTVTLLGGIGSDEAHTSWLAGGGFGWDVTPRLAVEATAVWLDRGESADGFSADIAALFSLVPPRRVVPFVKGGFGAYRAGFSIAQSPAADFYRRRMDALAGSLQSTASFTDPMFVFGAGIRVWLGDRVTIRPEVDARLVVDDSRAYWLTTAAIRLTYSFEDRPVTDRGMRPNR
jgi:hypothetical protein